MISWIRTATETWLGKLVLGVLFALLIVAVGIWGIGDIFRGGPQTAVASVGRSEVGVETFRRAFQNRVLELQRQARGLTTEQARQLGIDRQVLDQLIGEAAMGEAGRRLGLGLADEEIARLIAEEPAFRGPGGRFSRELLNAYLREAQLTEAGLIQEQRKAYVRRHIAAGLAGGMAAPEALLRMIQSYLDEALTIEFVVVPGAIAAALPAPDEAALRQLHEQRRAEFRAPEYRAFNLLAVLPQDFAAEVSASEAELQEGYERMLAAGRLGAPERRRIQQILFSDAAAAETAAKRLAEGLSFAALAEEMKLKPEDIDLGLKTKSELVDRAVAEAAFALAPGAVSRPVQGRFGVVLLRAAEVQASTAPPLAAVAETVRADVLAQKILTDRRVRDRINQLHDKVEELRTAGKTLEQAADELKLALRRVPPTDAQGLGKDGAPAGLPDQADLLRAVFASDKGVDNEAIRTRANGYLWFEITEVERARERAFDEVKAEVEALWRRDESARRTTERAEEILRKLAAGGALADAADEIGGAVERVEGVTRAGKDAISQSAAAIAFALAPGAHAVAPAAQGPDRLILRVAERRTPDFDPAAPDVAAVRRSLDRAIGEEIMQVYVRKLQDELGARVNEQAFRQATGAASQP